MDQDVLTKASAELTMPEACAIADKTLQYTVRSILWALKAPEILKVSHGELQPTVHLMHQSCHNPWTSAGVCAAIRTRASKAVLSSVLSWVRPQHVATGRHRPSSSSGWSSHPCTHHTSHNSETMRKGNMRARIPARAHAGSFLWHGRDLRAIKRPLFPPMMSLLTCPGHGHMGRGQASIPISSLQHAGLPSTLSTLAEDAVRAASESPFLDDKMASATAVLCVLRLPRAIMEQGRQVAQPPQLTAHSAAAYNENYREYALRSAVQVWQT